MKRLLIMLLVVVAAAGRADAQEQKLEEGLALKYIVAQPQSKTKHPPVIILLHGYGSNEQDLFGLKSKFPKKFLVVSARAPYEIPGGGYRWYEFSKQGDVSRANKAELGDSRRRVQQFVRQITDKYKADAKQVYLIGFSQGAIMCYEAGLTDPEIERGIAVLSGRVNPDVERGMTHKDLVRQMKIFIGHGTADERIRFDDGKAAVDFLKRFGIDCEFHEYPGMGHTISNDELNDLVKWLKE